MIEAMDLVMQNGAALGLLSRPGGFDTGTAPNLRLPSCRRI